MVCGLMPTRRTGRHGQGRTEMQIAMQRRHRPGERLPLGWMRLTEPEPDAHKHPTAVAEAKRRRRGLVGNVSWGRVVGLSRHRHALLSSLHEVPLPLGPRLPLQTRFARSMAPGTACSSRRETRHSTTDSRLPLAHMRQAWAAGAAAWHDCAWLTTTLARTWLPRACNSGSTRRRGAGHMASHSASRSLALCAANRSWPYAYSLSRLVDYSASTDAFSASTRRSSAAIASCSNSTCVRSVTWLRRFNRSASGPHIETYLRALSIFSIDSPPIR